ncbi:MULTISPECIES: 5-formyltetrahydrofolate cyclo-ligase [Metabacillus]|uniref:5-formyltetrahydrofolate cyclo-ligase n=1 Tax=Metabacillus TaxID=2675233 RepID=UPI0035A701DA
MKKKEMRSIMLKQLTEISDEEYQQLSKEIHKHLFSFSTWNKANTVAVTVSRGREVDTFPIIKQAWTDKKTVVVPKCEPATNTMEFRSITSFDQLENVFYGLKEPILSETSAVKKSLIDLILVPGICFDKNGYRIGYGGGYYDRYLMDYKNDTVSLAFSSQLINGVPIEAHDVPVSTLITEHGVMK